MRTEFELIARKRARSGTGLVRRLRREGDVPAVLYGAGKANLSIAIDHDVLLHSLDREDFHSAVITINTDGAKEHAILKDVQRHPHKLKLVHADFQRIDDKKPITMSLPIHFLGADDCVGVKNDGGIISHLLNDAEVVCLPKDLPESLELDISGLHLGESLALSDIKLPEGAQFSAFVHGGDPEDHDINVVTVMAPRVEVEPEEDEAEDSIVEEDVSEDKDDEEQEKED